jgi:excisionase family DNA binding protein
MDQIIVTTTEQLREILREELKQYHQSNALSPPSTEAGRTIFNLDQVCEYVKISKQSIYKLTGKGLIPHSKRGKRLYFEKSQIDTWLLENRAGNISDIERKADEYLLTKRRRRR